MPNNALSPVLARQILRAAGFWGAFDGARVIVGLSGGVDSSVAAAILQAAGFEVHAVFMKNWEEDGDSGFCSTAEDLRDAEDVCDQLQIPLHKVNFSAEYRDRVFSYFLAELNNGRTPNPDVLCNKEIKFAAFLDYAYSLGADWLATGHYARCLQQNGRSQLLKGMDDHKDQSYFLHLLNQQQLQRVVFPLGGLCKSHGESHFPYVRELAESLHLSTFNKKDSTGICFIGERDFRQFIQRYLALKPGAMLTPEGEQVGKHQGLAGYTIGQRQGLMIGGRKDSSGEPWFVVAKRLQENVLIVAQGEHPALYAPALTTEKLHWIDQAPAIGQHLSAKIRYRQPDQAAVLTACDKQNARVVFDSPQRAITPGQSIVFYNEDICLGGAIIRTAEKEED